MAKYVIANTINAVDAQNKVDELIQQGYPRNSISLLGSDTVISDIAIDGVDVESDIDYNCGDETLWERIKDFFGAETDRDDCETLLAGHRQDIENGNVLVIVDSDMVPVGLGEDLSARDTNYWQAPDSGEPKDTQPQYDTTPSDRQKDIEDETIRLEAERMNINKQNVQAGEVVLKKRVVEQNETVNVPLRHEEVVIERRPVNDAVASADASFDDETVTIPLWEEQVNVTKQPVVTEEIHVSKTGVENTRQVSAQLRKEELDVDKTGNVVLRDNDDTRPSAPLQ